MKITSVSKSEYKFEIPYPKNNRDDFVSFVHKTFTEYSDGLFDKFRYKEGIVYGFEIKEGRNNIVLILDTIEEHISRIEHILEKEICNKFSGKK